MAPLKRTCVLVAGMHRSGTSALARVVNILGCGLPPDLLGTDYDNRSVHLEPIDILKFHEELLDSAGSAWDDWTPVSRDWLASPMGEAFGARAAQTFVSAYGDQRLCVMKDPRLARLLPFWLPVLAAIGVEALVMIPVRNPLEVALSLQARDGSDPFYNHLLWMRHVLDAESGSRGLRRHFSTYDQLLENWAGLVGAAEARLGIKFPRRSARTSEEIDAFLALSLRHQTLDPRAILSDATLPDGLRTLYEIMLKWAQNGEDSADYACLDQIRGELDWAAAPFARLIHRGKAAHRDNQTLHIQLETRDREMAGLRAEHEVQRAQDGARIAQSESRRLHVEAQLEQARDALADGTAQHKKDRAALELGLKMAHAIEIDQMSASLAQFKSALLQRGAELDDAHQELQRLAAERDSLQQDSVKTDLVIDDLKAHVRLLMADVASEHAASAAKDREAAALRADLHVLTTHLAHVRGQIAAQTQGLMQGLTGERHRFFQTKGAHVRRQAALLRSTRLLDPEAYLRAHPDVAAAGIEPEIHYLTAGFAEGRARGCERELT